MHGQIVTARAKWRPGQRPTLLMRNAAISKNAHAKVAQAPPALIVGQTGITTAAIVMEVTSVQNPGKTNSYVSVTDTVIMRAYYNGKLALKQPM